MTPHHSDIPEMGSDMDEDEALRYAIALSLQEQDQPVAQAKPSSPPRRESSPNSTAFGSLGLDRKKMEEERLQRLSKRHRETSDDDVVEVPPPKRKPPPLGARPSIRLPFPKGTVKRTWARGYPRTGDDIKIEEVFQKDKLELAVISSFQWDEEWMLSKFDMSKTKLLLAAFAADEAQKAEMRSNVPPGIRFCFPPMNGPGSMHSKLQLLKYPEYIRIVIPTGNLVPYDWGETGVMENVVFLIDLPRLSKPSEHPPTKFSTELGRFLRAMDVDETMVSSLANYDFSETHHLGFVYTIPGGHTGDALKRIGYCGLGASVASLGQATSDPIEVDLVCASLGSINYDLVNAVYNACQGDDGMREYNGRTTRSKKVDRSAASLTLKDRFRVYFPTENTVSKSRGGKLAAGTICVQAKWWRSPTFPTELFRDCVNNRDGLLMHSKIIFVRKSRTRQTDAAGQTRGWAYVGSANLSESAWGRLVKDRVTGRPKMSCRNWECGVVVQVPKAEGAMEEAATNTMDMFDGTIPVPMQIPGPPYGPTEEPWFFLRV
ncbi:Fc.00g006490.m01.CDS01 [Cosmosporella sp. VM-42]